MDTVTRVLFFVASHIASATACPGGPLPEDQLAELLPVSAALNTDKIIVNYRIWLRERAFLTVALFHVLLDTGLRLSRKKISNS